MRAVQNATIHCGGLNDNSACGESDGYPGTNIYVNPVVVNNVRRYGNRGRGPLGYPGETCDCLPGVIIHEAAHNAFDLGNDEDFARRVARRCFTCAR